MVGKTAQASAAARLTIAMVELALRLRGTCESFDGIIGRVWETVSVRTPEARQAGK